MSMYFSNLNNVRKYLLDQKVEVEWCSFFPANYYVEWLKSSDSKKYLRIRSFKEGWFGTSLGAKTKSIGSIDLDIDPTNNIVRVPFWLCNDKSLAKLCGGRFDGEPIDDNTANEVKTILFDYADKIAKENNCKVIQRDVHNNLREFNEEIKQFGFELTGEKASDNPFWLVSTKSIN